jgi:hypothetical protein
MMNFMRRALPYFSILIVITVLILYFLEALNNRVTREEADADLRSCIAHLRSIEISIDAALLQNEKADFYSTLSKIGDKDGYALFRCLPNTNDWVSINPDLSKWKQGGSSNEVSLYCSKPNTANVWIARTFAGQDTILSNRPTWTPVPVWQFRK